ncbi:hypothetical protein VNO78_20167 [Psophocarpus tetragonolobus]|uniref:Uncharacterized protein n=1 Tax=Psophocarpus tetragonolobus TaxID=3891 RepID=A0AAN9XGY7_PSOTE
MYDLFEGGKGYKDNNNDKARLCQALSMRQMPFVQQIVHKRHHHFRMLSFLIEIFISFFSSLPVEFSSILRDFNFIKMNRPDHRLQDLRDKIFPLKKEKCAKASPVKLKINKKRKSPSSLSTREVEAEEDENNGRVKVLEGASTIASARRAKAAARIKFICSAPSPTCQLNKAVGEEEKQNGDSSEVENSNSTLKIRIPVKNSSKANSSLRIETNKRDNADLNLPISCLAEAGSKHKLLKASTMQQNGATQVLVRSNDNANASDQNESIPSIQEKTPGISADLNFPAQPEIGSNTENNKGFGPIWFCLVAAEEKDSSVTVSYIKKYLIKKLGLASENEVEIMLQGEPLYSSLQLKNLIDKWLQSGPKTEIHTSVGSSAKDFIMVLSYGRKA